MATEETNTFTTLERKTVRKINGSIKEHRKQEQCDKEHITMGRYYKMYKIPLSKMVWSCLKDAKPKNARRNFNTYNRSNKKNRKIM
jgi:hypothetical protein